MTCEVPGRPTDADGEQLVQVFEQLEQSAIRLALLATQYPHSLLVDRRMMLRDSAGTEIPERTDIITMLGQKSSQYEAGKVVRRIQGSGGSYTLQIPTLLDFAADKFHQTHCFRLRGIETIPVEQGGTGEPFIRIDFLASNKLKSPDVEGSVFLDSADYRLRRSEIRMTSIPRSLDGIKSVKVSTNFQDYVEGMPVIGLVLGVTELQGKPGKPIRCTTRTEQLITSRVVFQKARPDGVSPPK